MKENKFVELTELTQEQLNDRKFIRDYMNKALSCYHTDGNFDKFFHSLNLIIRSQYSIYRFSKKTGIGRTKIYEIFNCTAMPKFSTIVRMLRILGYGVKFK